MNIRFWRVKGRVSCTEGGFTPVVEVMRTGKEVGKFPLLSRATQVIS